MEWIIILDFNIMCPIIFIPPPLALELLAMSQSIVMPEKGILSVRCIKKREKTIKGTMDVEEVECK